MRYGNKTLGPRLRVTLRKGVAFGPGKADLLQGIRDTGSIAAAGRRMKMSYTRAWGLVTEMNAEFRAPLVASAKGGAEARRRKPDGARGRGAPVLPPHGDRLRQGHRRRSRRAEGKAGLESGLPMLRLSDIV